MKLSELLYYLEHIHGMLPDGGEDLLTKQYDPLINYVENHDLRQAQHLQRLKDARNMIKQGLKDFDDVLDDMNAWAKHEAEPLQHKLLAQSYSVYEDMSNRPQSYLYQAESILNNRVPLSDEASKFVRSRIAIRDTWKDSALIIRPGLEDWISNLVSFDPLYVFDHYQALLEPAQERFNDIYNNRVRWCVGSEHDDRDIFHLIPDGQIGFCFAWNFFYWKPFEIIRRYLTEIYTKLRPGGILAFTFNDGDRFGGANNAERFCGCFVPGSMLRSFGESLGYKTVLYYELDRAVTWMEFQKPGDRVSIKGGQAVARLMAKPKKVVDIPAAKLYTQQEIDFIRQEAINLNIDTYGRSIEKLQELVQKRKGTNT